MRKLDYQAPIRCRPRKLKKSFWVLLVLAVALILIGRELWRIERTVAAFNAKTASSRLMGMRGMQVVTLLGPPDSNAFYDNQDKDYDALYEGPCGAHCRVKFTYNRVVAVQHWMEWSDWMTGKALPP